MLLYVKPSRYKGGSNVFPGLQAVQKNCLERWKLPPSAPQLLFQAFFFWWKPAAAFQCGGPDPDPVLELLQTSRLGLMGRKGTAKETFKYGMGGNGYMSRLLFVEGVRGTADRGFLISRTRGKLWHTSAMVAVELRFYGVLGVRFSNAFQFDLESNFPVKAKGI